MESNRENKVKGSILGLAVGDSLGYPVEFMRFDEIVRKFGKKGVTDFVEPREGVHPKGTYSDDTQMSIAIAKALIDSSKQPYSVDNVMKHVKERFVEWLHDPENNRAPGNTCIIGCHNLAQGAHWKTSGNPNSKGCGAAMRSAPIGLFYTNDEDKLAEVAYASSLATHKHSTGIASGIATAYLTHLALENHDPKTHLEKLTNFLVRCSNRFNIDVSEFNNKISEIPKVENISSYDALTRLGQGWVGEEAVADALYCFLKSPEDYRKSVLLAANTDGDSDSLACITGAISGAYNGADKIPENWRNNVEKSNELEKLAKQLYKNSK